jgi:hypothetical protein
MNQSGVLLGALFAGFIVYLAMTKRLPVYWSLLTGGGQGSTPTSTAASASSGGSSVAGAASTVVSTAAGILNPVGSILKSVTSIGSLLGGLL